MSTSDSGARWRAALRRPGVVAALLAGLCGCVVVFNATFHGEHPYGLLCRQVFWLVAGFGLLLWCASRSADDLLRLTPPLTGRGPALPSRTPPPARPGVVFGGCQASGRTSCVVAWLGTGARLAREWLETAPAELAKPVFVLFLARWAPALHHDPPFGWKPFVTYLASAAVWLLPLALLPDPGLVLVCLATFLVLYWLQGGGWQHLVAATVAVAVGLAVLYALQPELRGLVLGEWHADGSFVRAALAAGGPLGSGVPGGWARYYLPGMHREDVFVGLAETVGLVGTLPILAVLGAFIVVGLLEVRRQQTLPRALVLAGMVLMLALPALLHLSAAVGLFPRVPVLLPFLSFGGGPLVGTLLSIWGDATPAADRGPRTARLKGPPAAVPNGKVPLEKQ